MSADEKCDNYFAKDEAKENGQRAVVEEKNMEDREVAAVVPQAEVRKEMKRPSTPEPQMKNAAETKKTTTEKDESEKPATTKPRDAVKDVVEDAGKNDAATPAQKSTFAVPRAIQFFQWVQPEPTQWSWPSRKPKHSKSMTAYYNNSYNNNNNNKRNTTDAAVGMKSVAFTNAGIGIGAAGAAAVPAAPPPELNTVTKQNRLHKWPIDWRFNQASTAYQHEAPMAYSDGDKYMNFPQISKPWVSSPNIPEISCKDAAKLSAENPLPPPPQPSSSSYMPKVEPINQRIHSAPWCAPTAALHNYNEMSLAEANMLNRFYATGPQQHGMAPWMPPPTALPIQPQPRFWYGPVWPMVPPYAPQHPCMHPYYWGDAMYGAGMHGMQNGYNKKATGYQGGGGGSGGGTYATRENGIKQQTNTNPYRFVADLPTQSCHTSYRSTSASSATSTASGHMAGTQPAAHPRATNANLWNYYPRNYIPTLPAAYVTRPYIFYNNNNNNPPMAPSWMCPPLPLQAPAHAYLHKSHVQEKTFNEFKESDELEQSSDVDSMHDARIKYNSKLNAAAAVNNTNSRRSRRRRRVGIEYQN